MWYEKSIDHGIIPDFALRLGIKLQILNRIKTLKHSKSDDNIFDLFSVGEISSHSYDANKQHYEIPINLFENILGPYMKYSSGLISSNENTLYEIELNMLNLVAKRAMLDNNQNILELGCGWGSSILYYAEKFPESQFTGVTNSKLQKSFIDLKLHDKKITNVKIVKSDINIFTSKFKYDRIFSIEMFEHMNNWSKLINNIAEWMTDDSRLFVHYFCHKNYFYKFSKNNYSWMEKYFFSGGSMPNLNIFNDLDHSLTLDKSWFESGYNYHKTLEFWYQNLKFNKKNILNIDFEDTNISSKTHYNRWKVFILACSELFKINNGEEYLIGHALLKK